MDAVINYSSDRDWFNTTLSFDYGGRYRIDVKPVSLTDNDDIGVRAFHADYPGDHSRDPALELTAVSDPPAGYVSWHFEAARNYGPFIDVYADNGTTGAYSIRVVYDPDRIWTRTEVVRGDLPHDDTTWAAIEVDSEEADQGVYHYYADYDWCAVELEEDTSYVFRAIAAGAYSEYMNPSIKLYDSDGNELASDYISHGDSSTTFVSIAHQVGSGEGGTYYIAVSNAQLWDDPDEMALLGVTEPRVLFSPFWGARYYVLASSVGGNNERRNVRTVSGNEYPRILNVRAISLPERSTLQEHIATYDFDAQDAITGYEVSGGVDADLFAINTSGVLTMKVEPDFEVPADSDMDNTYELQLRATSGESDRERSVSAVFTITVTDDESEEEQVLVSNTGKKAKGNATVNNSVSAIRIRTGSSADGYVIHSVAMELAEALGKPSGLKVSLWSNHKPGGRDRPKVEMLAFSNPPTIEARLTEFTAQTNSTLEPDTSYWIMIERTGDSAIKFRETASDSQDDISKTGWDIGSLRFHRPLSVNGPWNNRRVSNDRDQLRLRVIGYGLGEE